MHNFDRFSQNQENPSPEYGSNEFASGFAQQEGPLNEMQEMELATELMELSNDAELGRWVGKLFNKVKGVGRNFIQSPEGQQFTNTARRSTRNFIQGGIRSAGGYLSRNIANNMQDPYAAYDMQQLGQSLPNAWGNNVVDSANLGADGDNPDQGYYDDGNEMAREFVRYLGSAAHRYANSPYRQEYPEQAQKLAFTQAARQHMPQMLGGGSGTGSGGPRSQGTWQLFRGKYIVVSL